MRRDSFGNLVKISALVVSTTLISACGSESGTEDAQNSNEERTLQSEETTVTSSEELFSARIAPHMDFCRTCHVPGGIADTDEGKGFQLSGNDADDYDNVHSSWYGLGEGVETNPIIVENADNLEPHTGGKTWPKGSAVYADMVTLFSCWDDPDSCSPTTPGEPVDIKPLLSEGHRGGHAWGRFCEGQPDEALLPPDPRTLVQPGVNEGKAVYFNAYYKDCHIDAGPQDAKPETCGDWRARVERGARLMVGNGNEGTASFFVGNLPAEDLLIGSYVTAKAYNNIWKTWGLDERPIDYDKMIASRWGVVLDEPRNPYPLPGEDPNLTGGGSGQLPTALTQVRNSDGSWSGRITATCHMCHSGQIGIEGEDGVPGPMFGTNSLSDIGVMGRDLMPAGYVVLGFVGPLLTQGRGLGNITNFQLFSTISLGTTPENIPYYIVEQFSGSTGSEDPPIWWNYGHRPLKFYDGGMSADAERIAMSAFTPLLAKNPRFFALNNAFDWIEQHDQDAVAWMLNLKSPKYPDPVDTQLAEQGAILFHTKDLWAEEENADLERPLGGNGSCASCHGAYSPRFVNDPNFLDDPSMEGIAGYIVPRDLIGTDPRRVDGNDQGVGHAAERDWFTYPDQRFTDNDCGDQNLDRIRGERENGYLAPPLYGVWASAPYLHNGSVPNVWEVLKSSDRKLFWRRKSEPNEFGIDNIVVGFDRSFERAYDKEKLGWQYEELFCGEDIPTSKCNLHNPEADPVLDKFMSKIYANLGLGWNIPNLLNAPITNKQVESRKIYNSRLYSQDNGGHTFADVLTDQERRAVIEYLKTL